MKFLLKLEANFASMMFGRSSSSITHFVLILLKTWLPWTILVLFNSSIILMRVSTFLPQKIDIFIICVSFGLAVILMIMSISTFKTAIILYLSVSCASFLWSVPIDKARVDVLDHIWNLLSQFIIWHGLINAEGYVLPATQSC